MPNHVIKNSRRLAQTGPSSTSARPPVAKHMSIHEDILLNRYLEKFNMHDDFVVGSGGGGGRSGGGRARLEIDSPYLQKLTHSNFLHTIVNGSGGNHHSNNNSIITRPNSSTNRPPSAAAAGNSKQPPTKSDSLNQLKRGTGGGESGGRASSAPMRRRSESEQSLFRNNNNAGNKKRRNLFQRMPHLIRAVAFRNGSRDVSAYITAKSLIEVSSIKKSIFDQIELII